MPVALVLLCVALLVPVGVATAGLLVTLVQLRLVPTRVMLRLPAVEGTVVLLVLLHVVLLIPVVVVTVVLRVALVLLEVVLLVPVVMATLMPLAVLALLPWCRWCC